MASMLEFSRRIRLYANKAGELGDEAVRTASSAVLEELAASTPVDTSLAVSNWQVGIGSAPDGEIPAYVPGEHGSTAAESRAIMLEIGLTRLKDYKSGEGKTVHIVNNASHIGSLNDGHSTQAPRNFVQMAVAAGRRAVQNLRVSFK